MYEKERAYLLQLGFVESWVGGKSKLGSTGSICAYYRHPIRMMYPFVFYIGTSNIGVIELWNNFVPDYFSCTQPNKPREDRCIKYLDINRNWHTVNCSGMSNKKYAKVRNEYAEKVKEAFDFELKQIVYYSCGVMDWTDVELMDLSHATYNRTSCSNLDSDIVPTINGVPIHRYKVLKLPLAEKIKMIQERDEYKNVNLSSADVDRIMGYLAKDRETNRIKSVEGELQIDHVAVDKCIITRNCLRLVTEKENNAAKINPSIFKDLQSTYEYTIDTDGINVPINRPFLKDMLSEHRELFQVKLKYKNCVYSVEEEVSKAKQNYQNLSNFVYPKQAELDEMCELVKSKTKDMNKRTEKAEEYETKMCEVATLGYKKQKELRNISKDTLEYKQMQDEILQLEEQRFYYSHLLNVEVQDTETKREIEIADLNHKIASLNKEKERQVNSLYVEMYNQIYNEPSIANKIEQIESKNPYLCFAGINYKNVNNLYFYNLKDVAITISSKDKNEALWMIGFMKMILLGQYAPNFLTSFCPLDSSMEDEDNFYFNCIYNLFITREVNLKDYIRIKIDRYKNDSDIYNLFCLDYLERIYNLSCNVPKYYYKN